VSRFPRPTRSVDLERMLDTLLIFAVATILVIRTQLWLTNYPQLGGHGLHIAHLLWGGLAMLIALVLLLAYLNPVARLVAAVLGGIGLGFFIDELGKFLTSDNNYFFKPTAALIYVFFVIFFLAGRYLARRRGLTKREYLVNALELTKDAVTRTMTPAEKGRILELLDHADQRNHMVAPLREAVERADTEHADDFIFVRWARRLRDWYFTVVERRWFIRVVTAVFVIWGLSSVIEIIGLIFTFEPHLANEQVFRIGGRVTSKTGHFGFVEWADIVSSIIVGLLVLWGVVLLLRRSRLAAYQMFERALLISLFFCQVFAFIQSQFGAASGFLIDLLLFITVRYMIDRERELEHLHTEAPPRPAPALAGA
jgi:pimeloyl-ACP methyl ester carboxylesterase